MKIATLVLLLLVIAGVTSASDSGLEVPPGTKVYVLVEDVSEDAKKSGLTKELIESKVELQLRRNGIAVGTREDGFESDLYLYVVVGVTTNAFAVNIDFMRKVYYHVGDNIHSVRGSTYSKSGSGIYGNSQYMIQMLIDFIDLFSNDFLKSNRN